MITLARTNRSPVGEWWWTVDRWALLTVIVLMGVGLVLSLAASPAVALRLELDPYHFVKRHLIFLLPGIAVLLYVSILNERQLRRLALMVFVVSYVALWLTIWVGPEIKGATRWLSFGAFSFQPSEFLKPTFTVLIAWLFAEENRQTGMPGNFLTAVLLIAVLAGLVLQPDFGQVMLVFAIWCVLFFIAGVSWLWVGLVGGAALLGSVAAYSLMPHVASRVDRFLDPQAGDTYQVDRARDAFASGGIFGTGPGEGQVKHILPDAHADFIFAVAAEEFGIIFCLIIVGIFCFLVLRGLLRVFDTRDKFIQLAATGLIMQFGLQAIINIAVNLRLIPAKGMTLPFISYGGSSFIALALGMGMALAFTRQRHEGTFLAERHT
jgi:cell division protein FtsW